MTDRMHWMDTLRGVAIILVLLWHAPAIPDLLGYDMPSWIRALNNFFLPFRMPLLMFLSGWLLDRSLRKSTGEYYVGKIALIFWPYVLFAALHIALYGRGLSLLDPKSWVATGYLWFLFFIGGYYLIAPLLKKVHPSIIVAVALVSAGLLWGDGVALRFAYFAVFFFGGQWASRHIDLVNWVASGFRAAICALLGVGFGVVAVLNSTDAFQYQALTAPLVFAGIVAAIAVARKLRRGWLTKRVEFVGRNSIIFYTLHFPVMLTVTYGFIAIGWTHPLWLATVNLLVGATVCSLVASWRRVPPIVWVYDPRRALSKNRA